jgi:hypothetical protein
MVDAVHRRPVSDATNWDRSGGERAACYVVKSAAQGSAAARRVQRFLAIGRNEIESIIPGRPMSTKNPSPAALRQLKGELRPAIRDRIGKGEARFKLPRGL